jgi:oxygen-dependent protoporphyrinogen oxidase
MSNNAARSIAVLGAGITGLTAAYRLAKQGHRVRLFESTGRTGGAIRTELADGWLIESGPNSLLANEPAAMELIRELGLDPEIVTAAPGAKNRYIVRRGRPQAVPMSPPAMLTSGLFSPGAKFHLFKEFFSPRRTRTTDISLEEFVGSHFGRELVAYGLNPFVAGVYAGNPRKLSARYSFPKLWEIEQTHGSILRGQIAAAKARRAQGRGPSIISFQRGLQTLTDALTARLPEGVLSTHAQIEALLPGSQWSLVWRDGAATRNESFDDIIAALPASSLAQLRFGTLGERPLVSLENIEHPPVASLFLGYRREQVAHPLDGFGMLVPEVEKRAVLGVLFNSSLFPGRAPAGHVALTVMVGGSRQPELARQSVDKLMTSVQPDLQQLLGVTGAPVFQRHNFWPRAIPQYNLGYEIFLDAMAATERMHRGLFIGGQARDGIAVPACIAAGEKLAARIQPR